MEVATLYDRDAGWGVDAVYGLLDSPLLLLGGAGAGRDGYNVRVQADITPDSASVTYHVHYRIEKHEAENFARSFVSAGITSVALGPRIRLEYLFNGDGAVDRSAYNLPALLNGSHSFLDRHYLAVAVEQDSLAGPFSADVSGLLNLRDFSSRINAAVRLALDDGREFGLALETQLTFGDTLDDFWYYPDWAGLSFNWNHMNFPRF